MYDYKAYQLSFRTDFPIPEFPAFEPTGEPPDVLVRWGAVPAALEKPTGRGVLYQATADQFLLSLHDVARYLVRNGREIIVEPAAGSLASDVRVFLLGSCIGALLHQRGLLVLHAGAAHSERGAVLFTGPSGAGKSTLLGELMRRGYKMMVDDVCAVTLAADGTPHVLPGYPRTRLWSDAAQRLEQDTREMERTRPNIDKFERQIPGQFWGQPAPLRRVYLLSTSNKDELFIKPVPRLQAFNIVLQNTYRQKFLDGLEMRAPHFRLVATLARQTGLARVVRPSLPFRLTELADLIEQDLAKE